MIVAGATDIGQRREVNEDSILVLPDHGLFAVADGMGGHKGGKVASQMVTGELARAVLSAEGGLDGERLRRTLVGINRQVHEVGAANEDLHRMGSTCTAASIHLGHLAIVQVGDSRAYLARQGVAGRITGDHRAIQPMIEEGTLSEVEARTHPLRSALTRSIGVEDRVEVDLYELDLRAGDQLLLCSDGLTDMVLENEVLKALAETGSPHILVNRLIERANEAGGQDNISAVAVRLEAGDLEPL